MTKQLPQRPPLEAIAFNRLGATYFSQGQWLLAVSAYQSAIQHAPDYVDAYYNLGLAFNKLQRFTAAQHAYQTVLEWMPTHLGAQFQLACLYMREADYPKAVPIFLHLLADYPDHPESKINLATCYLKQGLFEKAKTYYLSALSITPDDTQVLFNLGVMSMREEKINEAIDYFLTAINLNPDLLEVHHNLGFIFLMKKDSAQALLHFREVLRLQPDNEAVKHTINIMMGKQEVNTSPPAYVRALFDSYADHFEPHLTQTLGYQVPQLINTMLRSLRLIEPNSLDVLDLGCGTGLCGEPIAAIARTLVGVDLSSNMLEVARQKNIYDELVCEELETFLAQQKARYDLIIAGDVLVYTGDLSSIFAAIYAALQPGGWFVFDLEISEAKDFALTSSGRFVHAKSYVDSLLKASCLHTLRYQVVVLRTQQQDPVYGHLYLVEKPSMIEN